MNQNDLKQISVHWLKSLTRHCEKLIKENRAGIEEYELYVRCQVELAQRETAESSSRRRFGKSSAVTTQHVESKDSTRNHGEVAQTHCGG